MKIDCITKCIKTWYDVIVKRIDYVYNKGNPFSVFILIISNTINVYLLLFHYYCINSNNINRPIIILWIKIITTRIVIILINTLIIIICMILLLVIINIINTKTNRDSIINDNIDSKMIFIKLLLIILKLMIKYQKLEIFRALILNRAFSSYFPSPLWNSSSSKARTPLGQA